jgi:hypothetical protein
MQNSDGTVDLGAGPTGKEMTEESGSPVAQKAATPSHVQPRRTAQKSRFFRESSTIALLPGMHFFRNGKPPILIPEPWCRLAPSPL